MLRSWCFV